MSKQQKQTLLEFLRAGWPVLLFFGGVIWWAAQNDSAISEIKRSEARITALENRTTILESGIGQIQLKIDGIKEDLSLIKSAVIK